MSKPFYLSDEYWGRLKPRDRDLYTLIRPQPKAAYEVDVTLNRVEGYIHEQERSLRVTGGSFDLNPDFQRGHVWTDEQKARYMESLIRGTAPTKILFNCPCFLTRSGELGDIPPNTFQCVDGLQRLTAVRDFMRGGFSVFGGLFAQDLKDSSFDPHRSRIQICVYEFIHRAELLQFYLDLNAGGTVHPKSELDRVRGLLDAAQATNIAPSKKAKP